jgi:hypothetical protein
MTGLHSNYVTTIKSHKPAPAGGRGKASPLMWGVRSRRRQKTHK